MLKVTDQSRGARKDSNLLTLQLKSKEWMFTEEIKDTGYMKSISSQKQILYKYYRFYSFAFFSFILKPNDINT